MEITLDVMTDHIYDEEEATEEIRELVMATKEFIQELPNIRQNKVDGLFSRCLSYAFQIKSRPEYQSDAQTDRPRQVVSSTTEKGVFKEVYNSTGGT